MSYAQRRMELLQRIHKVVEEIVENVRGGADDYSIKGVVMEIDKLYLTFFDEAKKQIGRDR